MIKRVWHRVTPRGGFVVVGVASVLLALMCAGTSWGAGSGAPAGKGGYASVVVRAEVGTERRVERATERLGGQLVLPLRIINGFSAKVPANAVPALRRVSGVVSVTPNAAMTPESTTYDPVTDMGSTYNVTSMTGARAFWRAGFTGKGVDVAVIDTGVAPVDGLTAAGKVLNGPDLTPESQKPNLQYMDGYGHGTFMAGLIAGRSNAVSGPYANDTQNYLGMAPDARIVSVKVGDALGNADVSQVIAAIDWVVQNRNSNGLNIRVLNISYGTDSSQPYEVDPLAFAAEQAWKQGIFVVAAAGNAGFAKNGSMVNPAYDPLLLAVGAADSMGTTTLADDVPASFSSSGTSSRSVDLLAPGSHIVGLRVPGSYVDQTYGSTGGITPTLFRGSGTSQAAAITSGAAALLVEQRPSITPDGLKAVLLNSAERFNGVKWQGRRELNLANALTYATPSWSTQYVARSAGGGSLELSRGSVHLTMGGVTLTGEQDIFGKPFVAAAHAALEATGSSWSGGVWNGSSWSGSSWSGSSWSGSSWSGSSWSGSSWSGSSWSGSSWSSNVWTGSSWSGSSWSGSSWSSSVWTGSSWSGSSWSGSSWSDASWSSAAWG